MNTNVPLQDGFDGMENRSKTGVDSALLQKSISSNNKKTPGAKPEVKSGCIYHSSIPVSPLRSGKFQKKFLAYFQISLP